MPQKPVQQTSDFLHTVSNIRAVSNAQEKIGFTGRGREVVSFGLPLEAAVEGNALLIIALAPLLISHGSLRCTCCNKTTSVIRLFISKANGAQQRRKEGNTRFKPPPWRRSPLSRYGSLGTPPFLKFWRPDPISEER